MSDCIFCQIVREEAPGTFVYRDDRVSAFMDIRPITPGHLLVIPKRHATYLADLDEPTGGRLFQVAMRLAAALRRTSLRCDGVNLFLADGVAAGQEVFHVHLHVIPRFPGDGFAIIDDFATQPGRDALDAVATSIRAELART